MKYKLIDTCLNLIEIVIIALVMLAVVLAGVDRKSKIITIY